jgi:hypothetical protein
LLPTDDEPEIVRESYHYVLGDPSNLVEGYHDWLITNDNGQRVFGYGTETSCMIPSIKSNYYHKGTYW